MNFYPVFCQCCIYIGSLNLLVVCNASRALAEEIIISPKQVYIGRSLTEGAVEKRIVLTGAQPFRIAHVECSDTRFEVFHDDDANPSHYVTLRFTPNKLEPSVDKNLVVSIVTQKKQSLIASLHLSTLQEVNERKRLNRSAGTLGFAAKSRVTKLTKANLTLPQDRSLYLDRAQDLMNLEKPEFAVLDLTKAIELSNQYDEQLEQALVLRQTAWLMLGEKDYALGDREMLEQLREQLTATTEE